MPQRTIVISAIKPRDVLVLHAAIDDAAAVARVVAPHEIVAPAIRSSEANVGSRVMILHIITTRDLTHAIALGDEIVRHLGHEIPDLESLDSNVVST